MPRYLPSRVSLTRTLLAGGGARALAASGNVRSRRATADAIIRAAVRPGHRDYGVPVEA
jgi:hypothetical protein